MQTHTYPCTGLSESTCYVLLYPLLQIKCLHSVRTSTLPCTVRFLSRALAGFVCLETGWMVPSGKNNTSHIPWTQCRSALKRQRVRTAARKSLCLTLQPDFSISLSSTQGLAHNIAVLLVHCCCIALLTFGSCCTKCVGLAPEQFCGMCWSWGNLKFE